MRRTAARLQLPLLAEGKKIVEDLVRAAEELQSKGLPLPDDYNTTQRLRSEVTSELIKVEVLRDQVTGQLRHLAGCAVPPGSEIQTIETFHVVEEPLDEDEAVAVGMKYRPDLNLLRAALAGLDAGTLPVIRQVTAGTSSLLSGPIRRCVPMVECVPRYLPHVAAEQVEKMRKQLQALCAERLRQADHEIRTAVRKIRAQLELIRLAQEREALAQKRVTELEEKKRVGLKVDVDLPAARRVYLRTRSDALHEIIEWELARVNLRKEQGLLVREVLGEQQGKCETGCR
jgi:outer membrane protein TolC